MGDRTRDADGRAKPSKTGLLSILAAGREWRAGGPGPKATLGVVLEFMGNFSGEWFCWPSMDAIAYASEQSVGTVRRHVAGFERIGLLRREVQGRDGGGRGTSRLILNVEMLLSGEPEANAQIDNLEGGSNAQTEGVQRANETPECAFGAQPLCLIRTGFERFSNAENARAGADEGSSLEAEKVNGKPIDTLSEDELERTFAIMWEAYPPRDGKRLGRKQAEAEWRKLSLEDRRAAHRGAKNLAEAVTTGGRFGVPDLHRWLRDRRWEEWQEPARVESKGQRSRDFMEDREEGWVPRSETPTFEVGVL